MIRRIEIPVDFYGWDNWRDWITWARRCGVDVDRAAMPGWVECDDEARTVTYEAVALNDLGMRCAMPVTVQLESPALPFPSPW